MRNIEKEEARLLDLEEAGLSVEQLADSLANDFVNGDIEENVFLSLLPHFGGTYRELESDLKGAALLSAVKKLLGV